MVSNVIESCIKTFTQRLQGGALPNAEITDNRKAGGLLAVFNHYLEPKSRVFRSTGAHSIFNRGSGDQRRRGPA